MFERRLDPARALPGPEAPDPLAALLPRRDPARATRLLGVLNLTPDSFHDGGVDPTALASVERARVLVEEGADALDLGAESTRPGAQPVPAAEETARLLPVLLEVAGLGVPISVDTMKAGVAADALAAGAVIINDVTGLTHDPEVADVCAEAGAGLVLMHMRGTPRTMKNLTDYDDVVAETCRFLESAVDRAVRAGVREDRILVDPGIGFAKTAEQNLEILRRLPEYLGLGPPLVVGASRKSFLAPHGAPDPGDRLEGTLATSVLAVVGGASVLRVHDVEANRRAVLVAEAVLTAGEREKASC